MKDALRREDDSFFFRVRSSYLAPFRLKSFKDIIPIFIPQLPEKIKEYAVLCDGIIFSGGDLDVGCYVYGCKCGGASAYCSRQESDHTGRIEFDSQLMMEFEKNGKPILGICLGMQIMACMKGGKLDKSMLKDCVSLHAKENCYEDALQLMHDVKIFDNTKLFSIIKDDIIKTNSAHHCFVSEVSDKVVVSATCLKSGTVEAIECKSHPFMIGVQWHPEAISEMEAQKKLFDAFAKKVKSRT